MKGPYLYGFINSNAWQSYVFWINITILFGMIARYFNGRSKRIMSDNNGSKERFQLREISKPEMMGTKDGKVMAHFKPEGVYIMVHAETPWQQKAWAKAVACIPQCLELAISSFGRLEDEEMTADVLKFKGILVETRNMMQRDS